MKTAVKKKRARLPKKAVRKKAFKEEDDIPDLTNDPFFVKKAEHMKEMLKSMGEVFEEED